MNQKRLSDREPAHNAQPAASDARLGRPSGSDGQRLQRWLLSGVGVLGLGALSLLAGCPANLENPQRFEGDASTSQAGSGSVGPSIPACVTQVFAKEVNGCGGSVCHTSGPNDGAGLDLTSPGVLGRLLDVPASHADVDMDGGNVDCPSVKLIDSSNPMNSWLLIKISHYGGTCGSPMPEIGTLSSSDSACLTNWVLSLGSDAGASTSGGSGGAASTSGGASSSNGGAATSGGSGGNPSGGATATGGGSGGSSGGKASAGAGGSGASGAAGNGAAGNGAAGKSGGGSGGASSTAGTGGN